VTVHDSGQRDLSSDELTRAVLASFAGAGDDRFREIAEGLVRHLHDFVTDVRLTEEEWFNAVDFLTRTGQISNDKRQEFVLLSDVLGVSMLVIGLAHPRTGGATESTVFGPFFVEGLAGDRKRRRSRSGRAGEAVLHAGSGPVDDG